MAIKAHFKKPRDYEETVISGLDLACYFFEIDCLRDIITKDLDTLNNRLGGVIGMNIDGHKITFIVNPSAAMGAVGRAWAQIRMTAKDRLGSFRSLITTGQGDAERFARYALLNGTELIVCVGGDGTFNEIINGFMGENGLVKQDSRIAFIPMGTGCDFIKSVRIPKGPENVINLIANSQTRAIDLGSVKFRDHSGKRSQRFFHNVLSFGLGGEVVKRVERRGKALGGFISFIRATMVSLFTFNKKRIRLKVDDSFDRYITSWHVAVANGQYQGGGMRIAPHADPEDGLFHVTVIGDLSLSKILINMPKLYNGDILEVAGVLSIKGKRVDAWSDQGVLLDLDGEQPGRLPVTVEIVPKALPIVASEN